MIWSIVMADLQVTCITKPHVNSPHEHITHLGNPLGWGVWPRDTVIAWIDQGIHTVYVRDPRTGKRAEVGVVRAQGKAPYLRTHADGYWNDNLLSLNQCLYA